MVSEMSLIYAWLMSKPGGERLREKMFYSYTCLIVEDMKARKDGQCWSGNLKTNIVLNRHRHDRCLWCGVKVGANHHEECETGTVRE